MAVGLFLLGIGYVFVFAAVKGQTPWAVIGRGLGVA